VVCGWYEIAHILILSDDTESTSSSAKTEHDRPEQEDFERCSSFDGEEGTTHVGSGDFISNYAKKTQIICPMKESRFKVQSRGSPPATYLGLHVKTLCQDDQGQGYASVARSTFPSLGWHLRSDFRTSTYVPD
jgi:hypothetical protein